MAFDADWRPAFRVEAIPAYKPHRVPPDGGDGAPDDLAAQVPVLESVLDALGIVRIGVPGFEADDVIGTLTEQHDGPVDVVTGDRDLFQLVRDDKPPLRVLYSLWRRVHVPIDEATVNPQFRHPGPGVRRVRGAARGSQRRVAGRARSRFQDGSAALIQAFGSIDAIIDALDRGHGGFPKGSRAKVAAARDYLVAAVPVVRVAPDAPVPAVSGELPAEARRPGAAGRARRALGPGLLIAPGPYRSLADAAA